MYKKIWIVDDNEIERFICKKMMVLCDEQIEISEFVNGLDALNKFKIEMPDKIILDINMPIMNGWEFLNGLTEMNVQKEKFIYILSSSIADSDKEMAKKSKYVIDFIVKPFLQNNVKNIC